MRELEKRSDRPLRKLAIAIMILAPLALGAYAGNQFGKGSGKTAATVGGAVGGAVIGHEIGN